ncbi:MAG: hypothetical protein LBV12_07235, partial [Puniceicoccales bacterium]|nr:hypothetical protein [Puniceicoccales bacterium]
MKSSKKRKKYLRDPKISWMDFNQRVLQEAADPSVPLVERMRFLGIYSNNLDEFYRVRVATLHRLVRLKDDKEILSDYPENPRKVLAQINKASIAQQEMFEKLYAEILGELEKKKIRLINETQVNAEQATFLRNFFRNRLVDSLNPIILYEKSTFPSLTDANIYLIIDLQGKSGKSKGCALVEVPTG